MASTGICVLILLVGFPLGPWMELPPEPNRPRPTPQPAPKPPAPNPQPPPPPPGPPATPPAANVDLGLFNLEPVISMDFGEHNPDWENRGPGRSNVIPNGDNPTIRCGVQQNPDVTATNLDETHKQYNERRRHIADRGIATVKRPKADDEPQQATNTLEHYRPARVQESSVPYKDVVCDGFEGMLVGFPLGPGMEQPPDPTRPRPTPQPTPKPPPPNPQPPPQPPGPPATPQAADLSFQAVMLGLFNLEPVFSTYFGKHTLHRENHGSGNSNVIPNGDNPTIRRGPPRAQEYTVPYSGIVSDGFEGMLAGIPLGPGMEQPPDPNRPRPTTPPPPPIPPLPPIPPPPPPPAQPAGPQETDISLTAIMLNNLEWFQFEPVFSTYFGEHNPHGENHGFWPSNVIPNDDNPSIRRGPARVQEYTVPYSGIVCDGFEGLLAGILLGPGREQPPDPNRPRPPPRPRPRSPLPLPPPPPPPPPPAQPAGPQETDISLTAIMLNNLEWFQFEPFFSTYFGEHTPYGENYGSWPSNVIPNDDNPSIRRGPARVQECTVPYSGIVCDGFEGLLVTCCNRFAAYSSACTWGRT